MQSKSHLWRLIKGLGSQKSLLLAIAIATIAQVGLTVYLPVLIGQVVDALLEPDSRALISQMLIQMLIVIGLATVVQWLTPLLANRLVYGLVADLRQAVMAKLHRLPLAFLDKQSSGDLVSRVTTDAEQLTNGLLMIFNQFFIGLLTILLTVISMGRIDLLMLGLVISLTPLSLFLARFIAKRSYHLYQNQTQSRGQLVELLEESISQQALLQQFNAQNERIEAFKAVNDSYSDHSQGAIFYASTVNPTTRFVNALVYALLAGVGALRIIKGTFTVGQLTTFLNYANQYTKPFNDISSVFAELQSALACAGRLYHLLDQADLAETGEAVLGDDAVKGQLDFEEVTFGYLPQRPLIKNLDLHIPAGSKVAIVGPTGAGKSTLINLLMRFYDLDSGAIFLDGKPISDYDRASYRQQIGMVLQETWLKNASVHDNIAYGQPDASREAVIAAAKAANADFFIRQLPDGYDTVLSESGSGLSQGQAQLLAIARVFLKAPKLLILDEATASVDTRTERLIQTAFTKLMRGRTSFIIAHRLSTIEDADLILVMDQGQILETGRHLDLMAQEGLYHQMQTAQVE